MRSKLLFPIVFVCTSVFCIASTLEVGVGKPYSTIQSAIDAAGAGDTVLVYPGTYYEPITIGPEDIILTSTYPDNPAAVTNTVISGEGSFFLLVEFFGSETAECVLNGFTITYGGDDYDCYEGLGANCYVGSILGRGTQATIQNCIISYNSSIHGGGIHNCDGLISNCEIYHNYAKGQYYWADPPDDIGFWYHVPGYGGGLLDCDGVIQNCTIVNNSATNGGGLDSCNGVIQNCTIVNNAATNGGGLNDCNGTIQNCTIVNNWATSGVDLSECFGIIINSILGEMSHCSEPFYSFSDFDPVFFADPDNGDFHLKSEYGRWDPKGLQWIYDDVTSPSIDSGMPWDGIGDPNESNDWRKELWPHGKRINMGAYGGTPQASMSPLPVGMLTDVDHDKCAGLGDLTLFVEDWLLGRPLLDTDFDLDSDVDGADFAILSKHWHLCDPAVLFVSQNQFIFSALEGYVNPDPTALTISNPGSSTVNWSIDTAGFPSWLLVDPSSGSLTHDQQTQVSVSVDITGLSAGQYNHSFEVIAPGAANSPQVVTVDLNIAAPVAHWELDESSGDVASDSSGNNHHGTLMNMDPNDWVAGKFYNCLDFDGVDDYVEVVDSDGIDFNAEADFTLCCWIQTNSINDSRILQKAGVSLPNAYGYGLFMNSTDTGDLSFHTWAGDVNGTIHPKRIAIANDMDYHDGQWHHVAGVRDTENLQIRIYVDGALKATTNVESDRDLTSTADLFMGTEYTHTQYFFNGLIDDVRVYDVALSAEQIGLLAGE